MWGYFDDQNDSVIENFFDLKSIKKRNQKHFLDEIISQLYDSKWVYDSLFTRCSQTLGLILRFKQLTNRISISLMYLGYNLAIILSDEEHLSSFHDPQKRKNALEEILFWLKSDFKNVPDKKKIDEVIYHLLNIETYDKSWFDHPKIQKF